MLKVLGTDTDDSRQEEHLGNKETVTYYHQNRDNLRISIMCYTSQVAPCKKLKMSFQLQNS